MQNKLDLVGEAIDVTMTGVRDLEVGWVGNQARGNLGLGVGGILVIKV